MADLAVDLDDQRHVTHQLLSNIPASHLGLISRSSYERLMGDLMNRRRPTLGFELINYDDKYFAHNVFEGGPAAMAGLKRGDRIILVDGDLVDRSDRLDWRTDDSFLADPPVHALTFDDDAAVTLQIERTWGRRLDIDVTPGVYSAIDAAKSSIKVVEHDRASIGYIHYWYMHATGVGPLLQGALEDDFSECDALIVDLRGRGGSAAAVGELLRTLEPWPRPIIALIDGHSRSAKEVIAFEMRRRNVATLVGESTAGAVIPAMFRDVGHDTFLMFPSFTLGEYTKAIEGVGVAPDIVVEDAGPYAAGQDPIYEAGVKEAARQANLLRDVVAATSRDRPADWPRPVD